MFESMDISTSGLIAQRIRMNTVAVNIANVDSFEASGAPAPRRSVIFSTGRDPQDRTGQGVHVSAIEKQDVSRLVYDPAHPYANPDGYVRMPGIDHVVETVNMMEAQRAYEANIAALDVTKAMINSSLRLLG